MRLSKPTPSFAVAVAALVVSLGGTSYAVATIGSDDIRDGAVGSAAIQNGSIQGRDIMTGQVFSSDIANGTLLPEDFAPGTLKAGKQGPKGPRGATGAPGAPGAPGPAGIGRWVLINADGEIEAQSGGFSVAAAYPVLENTAVDPAPSNALRANGNVYINANEDLSNNGVVVSIALQNAIDQNGDGITNGRAAMPDANPEFAGEISASMCGLPGLVACAPPGTGNTNHFVVSPRNSDGTVTTDDTRKRFYVIITGDSSDYVAP